MNEKRHRMIRRLGPWSIAVFLLAAAVAALGMGVAPRYIEELRIGGGYGDSADGGTDFEQDGDILTDGSFSVGGTVSGAADSSLTIRADADVVVQIDADADSTETFRLKNGTDTEVANIDESGNLQIDGDATLGGNDIKSNGGTTAISLSSDDVTIADDLTVTGNSFYLNDLKSWADHGSTGSDGSEALFRLDLTGESQYDWGVYCGHVSYTSYTSSSARGGTIYFVVNYTTAGGPTVGINYSYHTDRTNDFTGSIKVQEYATDEFEVMLYLGSYYSYTLHLWWDGAEDPDFSVFNSDNTTDGSAVEMDSDVSLVVPNHLVLDSDGGMVKVGNNRDFQLRYELSGSDHYFKVEDGSGNDMLTVLDKGTVGEVGVTGTLDVDGRIEYVNSGVITLDGNNPTPVDFTDEGGVDMPDATYAVLISAETTGSPVTVTWANRSTTGFEVSAWNVSTGNASTSSTLHVSWMVVEQ